MRAGDVARDGRERAPGLAVEVKPVRRHRDPPAAAVPLADQSRADDGKVGLTALDPDLAAVEEFLAPWADRIIFEVTEVGRIRDYDRAKYLLDKLRGPGFRIALDDLGAGYSGLVSLARLEPDFVKLDMELIRLVNSDARTRRLLRHIIEFAAGEGMQAIAEGVETVHQLRVLSELRCDKAQGYLISRPVPADAMRSTMVALDALGSLSMFEPNGAPATVTPVTDDERSRALAYPIGVGGMSSRPLGQPVL